MLFSSQDQVRRDANLRVLVPLLVSSVNAPDFHGAPAPTRSRPRARKCQNFPLPRRARQRQTTTGEQCPEFIHNDAPHVSHTPTCNIHHYLYHARDTTEEEESIRKQQGAAEPGVRELRTRFRSERPSQVLDLYRSSPHPHPSAFSA